jgi:threonine aldolase
MDGARIWNAHVASGVSLSEYGRYFDTLSVCLSKGLGAPIGSLMVGSRELISKARSWRKRYGGGMRQVGLIAAAGDYAIENNLKLLAKDHIRAKEIAKLIEEIAPDLVNSETVETNIVGLDLSKYQISADALAMRLKEAGILTSALGPKYLRLVTHFDITDKDIEKIKDTIPKLLKSALVTK